MNVLMLSTDARIFEQGVEVRARMRGYGRAFDELRIIVLARGRGEVREEQIGENVFAYRASRSPFSWYPIARRMLRQGGDWVITAQDPCEIGLIGWLLARRFRLPLQLQVHTDFLSPWFSRESWKNRLRVRLAKFLIPRADRIRVVSERIRESLVASGYTPVANRVTVLPIFVPPLSGSGTVDLHKKYPGYDRIILMASRLTREKNILMAIEAMRGLTRTNGNARGQARTQNPLLLIVGGGPELENLRRTTHDLRLTDNIKFESWTDDLASYYKAADCLLITSNYEGYGRTAIEAMAAGLPVVMTDVGLAGEVVRNGESGLVVPVGDTAALVSALERVLGDAALRDKLAAGARATAQVIRSEEAYLEAYRDALVVYPHTYPIGVGARPKLCYVVPAWREDDATHFAYLKEFVREVGKRFDVHLVVERGELPRDSGAVRVALCDSRFAFTRMLRMKLALIRARLRGCRTFYVHYSFFAAFAASFIARTLGGRTLYWNCGEPWKYRRPFWRERFERFTYRMIHTLVTGTAGLADQYAARYRIPREKIKVAPNWINLAKRKAQIANRNALAALREQLRIPPAYKIVLFVHRLSRRKGAHHLPEIIRAFKDEPVTFLVAGEGPERASIERQVGSDRRQRSVRFLGSVPNYQLPNYYSLADLFIMPSEEEGFPHVLLEAMAAGVPFVATDVGGVREIVPPAAQQYVVPAGAMDEFIAAMRALLSSESARRAMSVAFPAWIARYDLPHALARFREALAARPARPFRIYYVANARMPNPKAHGIQLVKMCEALVARGVDLTLVLPRKRSEAQGNLKDFYGLKQTIRVVRVPVFDFVPHTRFGFNLSAASFGLTALIYLLSQRIRGRSGIVYTIDLDQFSFLPFPLTGQPVFFETHASKRGSALYRFFLRRSKGIVAINHWIERTLVSRFGLSHERIRVLPNGIDLTLFKRGRTQGEARQELGLPHDAQIALYVGRFYNWKGLHTALIAAKELLEVQFYFLGGNEGELKEAAQVNELSANIHCMPIRPQREIPLWLQAANVCLVLGTREHEYSYRETSPMKLFEYMAVGRPIVGSRTPAIEEIVGEREAFLAKPDDPEALAAAVREAFAHPDEAAARGARAREKAQQFSWDERAKKVLDFIKGIDSRFRGNDR